MILTLTQAVAWFHLRVACCSHCTCYNRPWGIWIDRPHLWNTSMTDFRYVYECFYLMQLDRSLSYRQDHAYWLLWRLVSVYSSFKYIFYLLILYSEYVVASYSCPLSCNLICSLSLALLLTRIGRMDKCDWFMPAETCGSSSVQSGGSAILSFPLSSAGFYTAINKARVEFCAGPTNFLWPTLWNT